MGAWGAPLIYGLLGEGVGVGVVAGVGVSFGVGIKVVLGTGLEEGPMPQRARIAENLTPL